MDFISWSKGKLVTLALVKGQAVSGADLYMVVSLSCTLADLGGACLAHDPPKGPDSFFSIYKIFEK